MTNFLDLQNGWYNGLIQGLGQNEDSFQIIQPAPPIAGGDSAANTIFWSYYNNIPVLSLTQQFTPSGGNQFYSNYRALMSALEPATIIDVKKDIGAENFAKWQNYILSLPILPAMNDMPTRFRSWAMIVCPDKANIGSSDYAAILLDPIATAQNELTLVYTDMNGLPRDFNWSLDYNNMVNQLKNAPNRSFDFSSAKMDTDVKSSWSGGANSGFFGLWGSSTSTSQLSEKFASSNVSVSAKFDNILVFSNTPGPWYNSGAMALAYANKTGAPWRSGSAINWENTFGKNGNLQRFAANIVICSGMDITITSSASYDTLEQETIKTAGSAGFWPFYTSGGGSSSTNTATFSQSGQLEIKTSSVKGIPVVLGANVLSAAEFTGHSAQSSQALYSNVKQFKKVKEPVLS